MSKAPDSPPKAMPQVTPPVAPDMPAYTAQVMFEMNHSLGRIEGLLTSLTKQVDDVDNRLKTVEKHWHLITGAIALAVVLIPACAYAIWWSLADKIEAVLSLIPK